MAHRNVYFHLLIYLSAICFIIGLSSISLAAEIKIGALNDTTGATSDVGKDYALGIAEAVHYVNDAGGVNGKKIKLYQFDYGYRVPEALTKYNLFKRLKVVAVLGWSIADTMALLPFVTKDNIPFISNFNTAALTNPKESPNTFFFAPDNLTIARACITAWFEKKWRKHPDYGKRKPRLQCIYMFKSIASVPIKAIKEQAKLFGFDIGPDQDLPFRAIDTKSHVFAMKQYKPDLIWHGNTTISVANTVRDAYKLNLKADHIVNSWVFNETLPLLAKEAAEGVMGVAVSAFFGQDVPLMENVTHYARKYNPQIPQNKRLSKTVQAWASVMTLWEAMKRADRAGKLTGTNIRKRGFETFRNFEIGLGVSPITFTDTDHRPTSICQIQELKKGKFHIVGKIDMKRRFPDKWENVWRKSWQKGPEVITKPPPPSKFAWNMWPEEGYTSQPNFERVSYLKPGTEYILVLHLSAMPYYNIEKTQLSSTLFDKALEKYWLKTHRKSFKAKAVILADPAYIKIVGRNDRNLDISLENIRDWPPGKTFQENVDHLKILKEDPNAKFKYGETFFTIKTTKREGKAAIGISVWVKGRPVEEITTELPIAKNKETADKLLLNKSSTYYGLKGFEMFRPEFTNLPLPAAAIHFLEIGEFGNRSVYGILRVNQGKYKNTEDNPFDSWEVTTEGSSKLKKDLEAFSKNFRSGKMHNQEIAQHGQGLFDTLFPDENGPDAERGRNRFISFFNDEAKNNTPFQQSKLLTILIRTILQDFDYLLNVPLGMMAVNGSQDENSLLGYHFNVETPLKYNSFQKNIECLSKWTMVLPPSTPKDGELKAVRDNFSKHFLKWEKTSKKLNQHYDSMKTFAEWITTKSDHLEPPSILSIVSHHSSQGNSIHFSKNTNDWPLAASEIVREFDSPSVVILNGCGTARPGSEEFVRSFNKRGFETVIATNTTVSGTMAAHFMNCLAKQIEEHSEGSSFTVADAYYRALSCLYYGDKYATKNTSYGAQVLFYSILGDPNIRLCPPKE